MSMRNQRTNLPGFSRRKLFLLLGLGLGIPSVLSLGVGFVIHNSSSKFMDAVLKYPLAGGVDLAWSPDGEKIALSRGQGEVAVWSTEVEKAGTPLLSYNEHRDYVRALAWSPDSTQIASVSYRLMTVCDAHTGKTLFSYQVKGASDGALVKVAWSPDGTKLALQLDKTILLWQTSRMSSPILTIPVFAEILQDFFWSPDSQRLVAVGLGSMQIWNVDQLTGAQETVRDPENTVLPGPNWSPDWTKVAYVRSWRDIEIWTPDKQKRIAILKDNKEEPVQHVAWSPDNRYLVVSFAAKGAKIWDTQQDGSEPILFYNGYKQKRTTGGISCSVWSPDGRQIASLGTDGRIHIWQVPL